MVHFYSWLLQGYATNGPFTNHALVAFLALIADPQGLNLEPMLYQVTQCMSNLCQPLPCCLEPRMVISGGLWRSFDGQPDKGKGRHAFQMPSSPNAP